MLFSLQIDWDGMSSHTLDSTFAKMGYWVIGRNSSKFGKLGMLTNINIIQSFALLNDIQVSYNFTVCHSCHGRYDFLGAQDPKGMRHQCLCAKLSPWWGLFPKSFGVFSLFSWQVPTLPSALSFLILFHDSASYHQERTMWCGSYLEPKVNFLLTLGRSRFQCRCNCQTKFLTFVQPWIRQYSEYRKIEYAWIRCSLHAWTPSTASESHEVHIYSVVTCWIILMLNALQGLKNTQPQSCPVSADTVHSTAQHRTKECFLPQLCCACACYVWSRRGRAVQSNAKQCGLFAPSTCPKRCMSDACRVPLFP